MILLAAGCGGSSTQPSGTPSPTSPGAAGSNTLTATIDGATWTPTNVTARLSLTTPPYLEVDSNDAALDEFSFAMGPSSGSVGVATYQIGGGGNNRVGNNANYILPGGSTTWTAVGNRGSGSVTITAFSAANKTASGTFSFVLLTNAGSVKTVTNGRFSVTYN